MEEIKSKINVLSLFDGISCARVALERNGIKVNKYYSSEIDKYAISIAQKNYPDTIQLGDITEIKHKIQITPFGKEVVLETKDTRYLPAHIDLIIGGSPCQDLSIAKKNREGLKGCRSGLFYEFVRLLKEVKPKYFILENVNSMPKEAREEITNFKFYKIICAIRIKNSVINILTASASSAVEAKDLCTRSHLCPIYLKICAIGRRCLAIADRN